MPASAPEPQLTPSTPGVHPVLWAAGRILGSTAILADSMDTLLSAVFADYPVDGTPSERLACRERVAVALVREFQEVEIRSAEDGALGDIWMLAAQPRFARVALTADRGRPLLEFVFAWPTDQPRLVVSAHLTGGHPAPSGNVMIIDPATPTSLLQSLVDAEVIEWGGLA